MSTVTKITIPATEARKKLFKLLDEVGKPARHFFITKGGAPKAVMMSMEEWESWLETLEIMSDKRLARSIRKAEEDFKKGHYRTLDEVFGR
jgi:antitoxin YefM